jgi:hypothetical protein
MQLLNKPIGPQVSHFCLRRQRPPGPDPAKTLRSVERNNIALVVFDV